MPSIDLPCLIKSLPFSHHKTWCVHSVIIAPLLISGTELSAGEMKEVESVLHLWETRQGRLANASTVTRTGTVLAMKRCSGRKRSVTASAGDVNGQPC